MSRISIKDTVKWIYSIYSGTDLEIVFIPSMYARNTTENTVPIGRMILPLDRKATEDNPNVLILCKSLLRDEIEMKSTVLHEIGHMLTVKERGNKEYNANLWAINKAESLGMKEVSDKLKDAFMDWFFDDYKRKDNYAYLAMYRKAGRKAHKNLFNMFERYAEDLTNE